MLYRKPAHIDDPVADCISWHPISKESGFKTRQIAFHDEAEVVVSASSGGLLLCLFFFGLGAFVLVGGLFAGDNLFELIFFTGAGSMFITLGYVLYRRVTKPLVFDRDKDSIYYEGDDSTSPTRISSVHAIQIIPVDNQSPYGGWHSFEINLVLKNGERINVLNHGKKEGIDHDTQILEEFLRVPVWELSRH